MVVLFFFCVVWRYFVLFWRNHTILKFLRFSFTKLLSLFLNPVYKKNKQLYFFTCSCYGFPTQYKQKIFPLCFTWKKEKKSIISLFVLFFLVSLCNLREEKKAEYIFNKWHGLETRLFFCSQNVKNGTRFKTRSQVLANGEEK